MKKRSLLLLLNLTVFLSPIWAQDEVNPYKKLSKQFIGAVKRNEPYKNYRFFDTTVYGKMSEAQADKMVHDFIKKHGPIVAIEKTEIDTQGCKMATATAIKVKDGKFLWYHYFDQATYIQRFEIDTFTKDAWFYVPEPVPANYTKKEVRIETSAFIQLPGTVYLPNSAKKVPLVVLVHGSGPHDRNCTMGKNKIFTDMALQLVQKGIAVLVYDKRTYVYQFRNPFPNDSMDYITETVEDAVEAFEVAKHLKEVDSNRVYVAGHSQGGLCGPLIAKRCKNLKGLILLEAPGRSLLEVLPDQLDYIQSITTTNKEEVDRVVTQMKWQINNALKPDLNLKTKAILPFGAKPKYWLFDRNYKVLEEAKTLTVSIFQIQGGRDYNVTKKDYDLWQAAMKGKPNYRSVWIENIDHLFFEGVGMAKPEDAVKRNHVSKNVTDKIADYILK